MEAVKLSRALNTSFSSSASDTPSLAGYAACSTMSHQAPLIKHTSLFNYIYIVLIIDTSAQKEETKFAKMDLYYVHLGPPCQPMDLNGCGAWGFVS